MTKLAKATGGRITTNLDDITEKDLGHADLVQQKRLKQISGSLLRDAKIHTL